MLLSSSSSPTPLQASSTSKPATKKIFLEGYRNASKFADPTMVVEAWRRILYILENTEFPPPDKKEVADAHLKLAIACNNVGENSNCRHNFERAQDLYSKHLGPDSEEVRTKEFVAKSSANLLPIGTWNTSNVTDMSHMFRFAIDFDQPISEWNTSKVTDMNEMFSSAEKFDQPIGNWDTSKVTDMSSMFNHAKEFDKPIGDWDTSNVINMEYIR